MGDRAVDRHVRADADAGDHVAHLGDDRPGEQLADVVLHHCVDHAVQGHDHAEHHEDVHAGAGPRQGVDRGLGGEGAQEHGAVERGLAVGLGQPRMQRHQGRVQAQADHDQPGVELRVGHVHQVEGDVAHRPVAQHDARQQDDPADGVDEQVAVADRDRLRAAAEPDEEHRGKGHHLPEEEERQVVAGVDRAERSGHVEPGGHVLHRPVDVQAVESADHRHQGHDQGEHGGEFVHPAEHQLPIEEGEGGETAALRSVEDDRGQGQHGHQKEVRSAQRSPDEGDE